MRLPDPSIEPLFAEAGRVTVAWAQLESGLRFALAVLVGGDQPTALWLTADMTADELLRRIRTHARHALHEQEAADLLSICDRIDTAPEGQRSMRRQRNDVVHSPWAFEHDGHELLLLNMTGGHGRKALTVGHIRCTAVDLQQLAAGISQTANDLDAFIRRNSGTGISEIWSRVLEAGQA